MAGVGRKRTFDFVVFGWSERPVLGKADIQYLAVEICVLNVRFTPGSGHWSMIGEKVC